MTALLTGLVGIVVGGVLTGAVNQWADWRKRKRDLRTAARLVFADALQCSTALDMALSTGDWWTHSFRPAVDEWQQYRQDLAAQMSPDHLDTVQGAFRQVLFFDRLREEGEKFEDLYGQEEARDAVDEASGVLLIYARTRREKRRVVKEVDADRSENHGDAG